jgi:pimeloyl-ACP methyl ester carboxylesterase
MSMHTGADTDPLRTRFEGFRGGCGPEMVCLHGFTATWRVWQPVLPALTSEYSVFAPTLAGHHGGPPFPLADLSTARIVELAEQTLDDEGIGQAHLVGNSGGGWLALALAARGRARSVVALSPGGGWAPGSKADRMVRRFFLRAQFLGERTARLRRTIAARPGLRQRALGDVVAGARQLSPSVALEMLEGAAGCEFADPFLRHWAAGGFPTPLAKVDCPVRIAWGSQDRVLPAAHCAAGFRSIEQADWVMLPGAGHVPMHDDPERVARTILDFTRRIDLEQRDAAMLAA